MQWSIRLGHAAFMQPKQFVIRMVVFNRGGEWIRSHLICGDDYFTQHIMDEYCHQGANAVEDLSESLPLVDVYTAQKWWSFS